jgi:hypothetical protein
MKKKEDELNIIIDVGGVEKIDFRVKNNSFLRMKKCHT